MLNCMGSFCGVAPDCGASKDEGSRGFAFGAAVLEEGGISVEFGGGVPNPLRKRS